GRIGRHRLCLAGHVVVGLLLGHVLVVGVEQHDQEGIPVAGDAVQVAPEQQVDRERAPTVALAQPVEHLVLLVGEHPLQPLRGALLHQLDGGGLGIRGGLGVGGALDDGLHRLEHPGGRLLIRGSPIGVGGRVLGREVPGRLRLDRRLLDRRLLDRRRLGPCVLVEDGRRLRPGRLLGLGGIRG
ncbi:hypothetical protein B7486_76245, partial [cyanobacterium TDX16]